MIRIGSITISLTSVTVFTVAWILLLTAVAKADCSTWIFPEQFTVHQTNGYDPVFHLKQKGDQLTGSALYLDHNNGQPINGTVYGHIGGSYFEVTVDWPSNPATSGVYSGNVDASGHLRGRTYDRLHPANKAEWSIDQPLVCVPQTSP